MSRASRNRCRLLVVLILLGGWTPDTAAIPCLSGFVRDVNGNPLAGVDLDFIDPETGEKLVTLNDNTDASGFYNVCVIPGVYHVTFEPPPGSHLMGKRLWNVDLTANVGRELDAVLEFGTAVTGTVTDPAGTPLGDVDIDVDRVTGGRIFTPGDNTDPVTGIYRVVIPDGVYRFRFEPPPGSRWRGAEIDSVDVTGDTVLDATLEQGQIVSGYVSDTAGSPVPDIDVDLRDHFTGAKIFVANNSTGADGNYSIAVPIGTFHLRFSPDRGSRFVAQEIDSFVVSEDRRWDQTLDTGVVLSFEVRDFNGNPVEGADIDVKLTATGEKVFTPNDKTDAAGQTAFAVPPDTYDLRFDPPPGTVLDRLEMTGIPVTADRTVRVQLPEVRRVQASGRVVDGFGAGLAGVRFEAHVQPGGAEVYLPTELTDTNGFFDLSIPIGTYEIFVIPDRSTRYIARRLRNVTVGADSVWGEIGLDSGWRVGVSVVTEGGGAIGGADVDVVDIPTGEEVLTPYDNTDASGNATVVVASGTYTVLITPPAGSEFGPASADNFIVSGDTNATFVLATIPADPPQSFVLYQNYPNPFNGETTIEFALGQPAEVSVEVFDVAGRRVAVLVTGEHGADNFITAWDGTDGAGRPVAGGVYFLRMRTPMGNQTRKMILLR